MGDQRADAMLLLESEKSLDICRVECFCPSAARIARKECEYIGTERYGFLAHGKETLGRRKVAADMGGR